MRTELPVFKRCCFCVPLRYGLITWGYIKMVLATIVTIALSVTMVRMVSLMIHYGGGRFITDIVILSILLFVLLMEIGLNILFVVGGHKKNVKLLRIYYIYNLVLWGLSIVLLLVWVCFVMVAFAPERFWTFYTYLLIIDFSSYFFNIIIQSYFLLLLRSEIIKLRNNCQFEFSNNAVEAECTMKCRVQLIDEEMGTEDERGTAAYEEDVCQKTCQSNGTCHKNGNQN